jgi:H+/Cl- antiporter ClcA
MSSNNTEATYFKAIVLLCVAAVLITFLTGNLTHWVPVLLVVVVGGWTAQAVGKKGPRK